MHPAMMAEVENAATVLARFFANLRVVREVYAAWLPYDLADDPLPAGPLCRLYLAVTEERGRQYRHMCRAPEPELVEEATYAFGGDELYGVRIAAALRQLKFNVAAFLAQLDRETAYQLTELQHVDIVLVAGDWQTTCWPYTSVTYENKGQYEGARIFGKDWKEHAAGALCFMPLLDSFLPVVK